MQIYDMFVCVSCDLQQECVFVRCWQLKVAALGLLMYAKRQLSLRSRVAGIFALAFGIKVSVCIAHVPILYHTKLLLRSRRRRCGNNEGVELL